MSKLSLDNTGQIRAKRCQFPVYFQNNARYPGGRVSLSVGDIVEFTYHYHRVDDRFTVINIKCVSTVQEEMQKLFSKKPTVQKRQMTQKPSPFKSDKEMLNDIYNEESSTATSSMAASSMTASSMAARSTSTKKEQYTGQIYNDGSDIEGLATLEEIVAFVGPSGCSSKEFEKQVNINQDSETKADHAYALLHCLAIYVDGKYLLRRTLDVSNEKHREHLSKLYHCAVSVESRPYEYAVGELKSVLMNYGLDELVAETKIKRLIYEYWAKTMNIKRQIPAAKISKYILS